MGEYKPPFTITNEILSYVSSISEKIGRITAIRSLETKPHLRKNNRIKSIHSSLKIEANSLSLGQVRDVINGRLVLGEQKEIQEVKNAYAAYESLSEINPYSIKDLKKFHGIMTKYLVEECGEFRHGEEGVFNGDECIFMAPPAQFVPQLMDELFEWMKKSRNSVHPLIMSSVFHYEFVFIHPFADGNGRMARLWHTAILSKWKPVFEYIPIESRIEKFQDEYYDAQKKYADYVDTHDNLILQSVRTEQERLQNDMSLAYQVYSQVANQLQVARAKVQEEKPVFAVVEPAVVPRYPSGMGKKSYLIIFLFLSVVATAGWLLFGKDYLDKIRKELV